MPPAYRIERGQMVTLDDQASEWRTQQAGDAIRGSKSQRGASSTYRDKAGRHSLVMEVASWPTPTLRDHKGGGQAITRADGKSRMDMLDWRAEAWRSLAVVDYSLPDRPTPSGPKSAETRRRLNPLFVEWLMGWPAGLSGCDTAATVSCRSPLPTPGCDCMDCWLGRQREALEALLTIAPPAQATLL